MPSLNAFFSGLTALIVLLTGFVAAIKCFLKLRKKRSNYVLLAGLMLLIMGSYYLGLVCT